MEPQIVELGEVRWPFFSSFFFHFVWLLASHELRCANACTVVRQMGTCVGVERRRVVFAVCAVLCFGAVARSPRAAPGDSLGLLTLRVVRAAAAPLAGAEQSGVGAAEAERSMDVGALVALLRGANAVDLRLECLGDAEARATAVVLKVHSLGTTSSLLCRSLCSTQCCALLPCSPPALFCCLARCVLWPALGQHIHLPLLEAQLDGRSGCEAVV